MIRWKNVITAILDSYPGVETVIDEASGRFTAEGATDRIVVYPIDGVIVEPTQSAQGIQLDSRVPQAIAIGSAIDDVVWERRVNTAFEIWAPTADACEDRLHALLVAISGAVNSTIQISDLREAWPQSQGDITSGGCAVVLTSTLTVSVVRSDHAVVANEDPIGTGFPVSPVTSTEIVPSLNDEEIAPAIWETET